MDVEEKMMRLSARWLRVLCHSVPSFICSAPHAAEVLSVASLYVFVQALGLLWVFLVSLLASTCTRVVTAAVEPRSGHQGGASFLLETPCRAVAVGYVYYCVIRMLLLFGHALWTVTWETYHNFPTMRRLLLRRLPKSHNEGGAESDAVSAAAGSPVIGSPSGNSVTEAESDEEARRKVVLLAPLIVVVFLNLVMFVGQLLCKYYGESCQESFFFDGTSRVNRNFRFVLFMGMGQWLQAWTGLFPKWHVALTRQPGMLRKFIQGAMIFCLIPVSVMRLSAWYVEPARAVQSATIFGVHHHTLDTTIVIGWCLWMLSASLLVGSPSGITHSGFEVDAALDDKAWRRRCTLFKYTLFLWFLLHFMRGCICFGPAHAQNDLIATSCFYPFLMCFIWTVTYMAVSMTRYTMEHQGTWWNTTWVYSLCILTVFLVALAICWLAGRAQRLGVVLFVFLHLCRQTFRIARRWARLKASGQGVQGVLKRELTPWKVSFAVDPKRCPDLSSSYSVERRLGRLAVRVLMLVCTAFCGTLVVCLVMAHAQERIGFFFSSLVTWHSLPQGGVKITNSGASVLTLSSQASSAEDVLARSMREAEGPVYAICESSWHGMQLVDYALLSLSTYMDVKVDDGFGQPLMEKLFPHLDVRVLRTNNGTSRRWVEVEVNSCEKGSSGVQTPPCEPVTVVAVSGTDPTRIIDYYEDLRMWTEPVVLQLLATFFPTVRAWPRGTTAMVIGGIHSILAKMDIADDNWHYKEILQHVRSIPRERKVVVTGHSLGGGIALVVGALTGRLAIALQPPGIYHSLAKHQVQQAQNGESTLWAVHERSVSVIVEGDWVQNFDAHGGLVQTLNCDQSKKSFSLGCHLLEGAICHLLRHCGDRAERYNSCQHEYMLQNTAVGAAQSALEFAQGSWTTQELIAHWDSILIAGALISTVLVARYGAPALTGSSRLTSRA